MDSYFANFLKYPFCHYDGFDFAPNKQPASYVYCSSLCVFEKTLHDHVFRQENGTPFYEVLQPLYKHHGGRSSILLASKSKRARPNGLALLGVNASSNRFLRSLPPCNSNQQSNRGRNNASKKIGNFRERCNISKEILAE